MLKKKFTLEANSLSAQLKSTVQMSLSNVKSGMSSLSDSEQQVVTIQGNLKNIDVLCVEASNLIENYDYIKQVSQTHQNFVATRKVYDKFSDLDRELERVRELLNEDEGDSTEG